ncbi:unnamed protein product [Prunus armeniaca]|uniref:Uncharacterized protein n=1 Tax=Prunus armeniaca TaxID=36596 RepID=A0A6J5TZP6_PRUAR|nr:unnamed protein product [Prunus armeniaca]
MSGMGEIDAREIALVMQRKCGLGEWSYLFAILGAGIVLRVLDNYELGKSLVSKCGFGRMVVTTRQLIEGEDYFGAVKVKNLPWAEPTENSE